MAGRFPDQRTQIDLGAHVLEDDPYLLVVADLVQRLINHDAASAGLAGEGDILVRGETADPPGLVQQQQDRPAGARMGHAVEQRVLQSLDHQGDHGRGVVDVLLACGQDDGHRFVGVVEGVEGEKPSVAPRRRAPDPPATGLFVQGPEHRERPQGVGDALGQGAVGVVGGALATINRSDQQRNLVGPIAQAGLARAGRRGFGHPDQVHYPVEALLAGRHVVHESQVRLPADEMLRVIVLVEQQDLDQAGQPVGVVLVEIGLLAVLPAVLGQDRIHQLADTLQALGVAAVQASQEIDAIAGRHPGVGGEMIDAALQVGRQLRVQIALHVHQQHAVPGRVGRLGPAHDQPGLAGVLRRTDQRAVEHHRRAGAIVPEVQIGSVIDRLLVPTGKAEGVAAQR